MQPWRGSQSIAWVRGHPVVTYQISSTDLVQPAHAQTNQKVNKMTDVQSTNFSNIETNERLYCMRLKQ